MKTLGRIQKRSIPFMTQLRVLFGGALFQFGSFFFWFGLPMSIAFVLNSEAVHLFKFDGDWVVTEGVIQEIEETNSSVNDRLIYHYHFSYNIDGQSYQGYSSDTYIDEYARAEIEVPIEYKSKDATRARIKGMRQEMFSYAVLFILIFPGVGALLYFTSMRMNIKKLRLLKVGETARGSILRSRETGTRINDQPVYEYEFSFEVDGRTQVAKVKTHLTDTIENEETKLILYNPNNPADNIVYDGIGGIGKLDMLSNQVPNVGLYAIPSMLSTIVGIVITSLVLYSIYS